MLQALDAHGETKVLNLCNRCRSEQRIPQDGRNMAVVVSFQKGKSDDHDPVSYTLLPLLYTVYLCDNFRQRLAQEHALFIVKQLED